LIGQLEQPANETVNPSLWQLCWNSQRKESRPRPSTHGGDVAQSTGKATMANRIRRVPCDSKMNVFKAKIRCDKRLVAFSNRQHGAIVPNALGFSTASPQGSLANSLNNELFLEGHWENVRCARSIYTRFMDRTKRRLIAHEQVSRDSHYDLYLQYFSGISPASFIDTPTLVCYGLISFISYQPSTRLAVKSSAGKESRKPAAFQLAEVGSSDQPGEPFRNLIVVGVITGTIFY
jgi:hypothetical protein